MFIKEKDEISSEKPDSSSMNRTLDSLAKIDNKLYFHVGVMDDSAHLIISAEGCPELMDTVASIVNLAPKLEGWGFIAVYDGLALFGQRNPELYPETVNGEVLYKRLQNGDCPWVSRPVDFDVVFPSEYDAIQFSETINENGFEIEVSPYDGAEGYTHQVHIVKKITPTLKDIEEFESFLESKAKDFRGRNDGWGSYNIQQNSSQGCAI